MFRAKRMTWLLATAALSLGYAVPANAQASRTWVSGTGDDANPCSRTAPCKTFPGAFSKTATGGEIDCIDSAGFGVITINKSITIDCPGVMAGILSANSNAVVINAPGSVVTLRNLTINGIGTATGNGIRILAATAVNVDNLTIENIGGTGTSGQGVSIETSANVAVNVQHSRFFNINNVAIHSNPTGGTVTLKIDNVEIAHNGTTCIDLRQNTNAVIDHSTITECLGGGAGLTAELGTVTAHVSNSVLANSSIGIFVGNGGAPTVRIYGNVVTGNLVGLSINAGQIISYGNNAIRGNGSGETPSGTATGTQ